MYYETVIIPPDIVPQIKRTLLIRVIGPSFLEAPMWIFYWIQANDSVKSSSEKYNILAACTYHPKVFRNFDEICM